MSSDGWIMAICLACLIPGVCTWAKATFHPCNRPRERGRRRREAEERAGRLG